MWHHSRKIWRKLEDSFKNAVRGTIRYIRENNPVLIKGKDTDDVVMYVSLHEAESELTVARKVKNRQGCGFTQLQIPYAPAEPTMNTSVELTYLTCLCNVLKKNRPFFIIDWILLQRMRLFYTKRDVRITRT